MQQLLSALITYPESFVFLAEDPANYDVGLRIAFNQLTRIRKSPGYISHDIAIRELLGAPDAFHSLKQFHLDNLEHLMPCMLYVAYQDYHGTVVCQNRDEIFYLDNNPERDSSDNRHVGNGYFFFKLTLSGLRKWFGKMLNGDQEATFQFLGYRFDKSEFRLGFGQISKRDNLSWNLIKDTFERKLAYLIGFVHYHPEDIEYSIPRLESDSNILDFEAIRAGNCRDIICASIPNTLTSGQLADNPKWLYIVQTAIRIDLQEQIQLLLARLQDIPSIEIVTYE